MIKLSNSFTAAVALSLVISACATPEQLREKAFVETRNGQPVYKFTSTQLRSRNTQKAQTERIANMSKELCPSGSKQLNRSSPKYSTTTYYMHFNGMIIPQRQNWSDVDVTIICTK